MTQGGANVEEPMEIIINIIDQNDNKPIFNQSIYMGEVPEASQKGKVTHINNVLVYMCRYKCKNFITNICNF